MRLGVPHQFVRQQHETFEHVEAGAGVAEVEPERDRLAQALKGGAKVWEPLITGWPAERFDGQLNYTNMRGQAMSLPFATTLAAAAICNGVTPT